MHARPRIRRSPVLLAALLCLGAALAGCSRGGLGYRFLAGDRRSGLPVAATVSTRLHFRPADGRPDSWITLVQEVDRS